ncbi:lipoate--protein ligase [Bowdeniella nasicola]|uniref:Lipoate--protein ligase n=1 Tax=Bowdeniella nasicola TaxID=208480 RepID=A0A1Q5Q3G6_9ACTO|nr:biotin/lipoate A/B protein ligase family protein [Bowdeniella nasicola]OKL54351.1 lipoate--protein ligase [Bowdeniella nasicola]
MRGEFKVRGGKLVAVDCDIENDRLANVNISGDFFLEPDTALEDLNAALTGMSASSSVEELKTRMDRELNGEIAMIGFSTEAVAIAVRRALGQATGWYDHTFEVIHGPAMHPAMHVALDQVLPGEIAAGRRGPIMRIWEWDAPLVVIGSFQSVKNEIDPEGLAAHDIMLVRRISGGGAMFMEAGNCITYSLIVPTSLVEGLSFERSYSYLDDWVMGALADVGINAHYVPLNDIASEVGKIGGAAQKRFANGVVLHHVTMAYDIDANKMLDVLRIGREKLSDKGTRSANKRVDPMRSQTGMAREDIIDAFIKHFEGRYDTVRSDYRPEEIAKAEELVKTKFLSEEWTYRVP